MIFIYVVCKDHQEAQKIAKVLLEKKMAVCANLFPIDSLYWWDEKITEGHEVGMFLKTLKQNYRMVRKEIESLHSYEVPFIGSFKVNEINGPYSQFLKKSVKKYYGKKSPQAKPNPKVLRHTQRQVEMSKIKGNRQ